MADFELIIFDCDGVLVDSERIANEVFASVLNRECGFSLSLDDMFESFVGRSSKQCMELIEEMLGRKPSANLEHLYKRKINEALKDKVTAVKGIEKVLSELTIPYCVASSGSHEKMDTTLGKTNLLKYFEGRIYSTSDVAREKPYPDVYLHAAKRAGNISPKSCLVIEDSPRGVEGGVAAGMTVFAYAELMSVEKLSKAGAHHIFNDMGNLLDDIKSYKRC